MRKNILTIIVMATSLVNLVLTIVLVFAIMPAMNKTSVLVDKVASVVDLEIEDANAEGEEYTMEDLQTYTKEYGSTVNINLKRDAGDTANHYAQISGWVISFNNKAEDFTEISEAVQTNDVYVDDIVKETISGYTVSTVDVTRIKTDIIKKVREKYNTKAVVDISLSSWLTA